jgi:hypothetical protein
LLQRRPRHAIDSASDRSKLEVMEVRIAEGRAPKKSVVVEHLDQIPWQGEKAIAPFLDE